MPAGEGESEQLEGQVKELSKDVVSDGLGFRLVPPMGSAGTQTLSPSGAKGDGLCIFLSLSHWPRLPPGGSGDMTSPSKEDLVWMRAIV